ncbi:hypothetical protein ACO0K9_27860 [Undibacterium sp. Ji50W]|uniref:hypothetical protein n=1 Tax=Undibacterium sp. Ji50W TaxID=3413041 RepID=UPI003BF04B47
METQDQKVLYSLAQTMEMTRAELDGMRIVCQGVLNALATDSNNVPVLVAAINSCIEGDMAVAIASPMTDAMLQQRIDWVKRLLPPQVAALINIS